MSDCRVESPLMNLVCVENASKMHACTCAALSRKAAFTFILLPDYLLAAEAVAENRAH